MASRSRITSVQFIPAHTGGGLLGFASFVLDDDVVIDGVTIRRTLLGELTVSWPGRRDRANRFHPHVRPVDDDARHELEGELLSHLHRYLRGGAA